MALTDTSTQTSWGWILAWGIIVILIGIFALVNPLATGVATGFVLGITLLFYGVAAIVSGFSALSGRGGWMEILLGFLALAASACVLMAPVAGALTLVWAIGFWLVVSGILQIVVAIRVTFHRGWRIFTGIVDVLLGAYLLAAGPLASIALLAFMVGISFLFRGLFLCSLAFGMRRASRIVSA